MSNESNLPVAVIGAGISGIAAAHVLKKNGYHVIVFEKSESIGGVWSVAYPNIRLQNISPHYYFAEFPWPFTPDRHPTGEQILRYLNASVEHFQLDVRLQHEVLGLEEQPDGWLVRYKNQSGIQAASFGYVVVSSGQYTDGKYRPCFPGQDQFSGKILTERDIHSLDQFDGQRVVIVGFGKSALDMATFAAPRSKQTVHIFRTPRWTIPERILGIDFTHALFSRFGSVMMPSWAHPTSLERFLHHRLGFFVAGFWHFISSVFRFQALRYGRGKDKTANDRLERVLPAHRLIPDLRSAAAIVPDEYFPLVAAGKIKPYHAELAGFSQEGVILKNGETLPCDLVVLSLGSQTPIFPFLPDKYRHLLEGEQDGVQLYRHLIHPRIPRMGFAGFNHGFMHIPEVEIGTLWLIAVLRGELALPPVEEMERSIERIRSWKRANIQFEPSRSCATNTRFQQYLDILLKDLGVSPYRKLPNVFAEVFGRYAAADYGGVLDEYNRRTAHRTRPLTPLRLDT
jgi:cation diffusion facilitator CzcD-associated flavoprotein CzcO